MKKLLKQSATIAVALGINIVIGGAFLVPSVSASTFYQQLSDSSGTITPPLQAATFTVPATTTVVSLVDTGLLIYTPSITSSYDVRAYIGTSPAINGNFWYSSDFAGTMGSLTAGTSYFLTLTAHCSSCVFST